MNSLKNLKITIEFLIGCFKIGEREGEAFFLLVLADFDGFKLISETKTPWIWLNLNAKEIKIPI